MVVVNFGTAGSDSEGAVTDSGSEFSDAQGFGWVTQSSSNSASPAPLDLTGNVRDRGADDSNTDSLIHLQYPTGLNGPLAAGTNRTPGAWEYNLANGSYLVSVGVGDAEFTDSSHVVNVEGESVIAGFTPTEDNLFAENTVAVDVTDGRLSLDAIGGDNTKLNFVEITAADGSEIDLSDSSASDDSASNNLADNNADDGDTPTADNTEDAEAPDSATPTAEEMGDIEDIEDTSTSGNPADSDDADVDAGEFSPVKVNFGTVNANASDSIQDIGSEYSDARGFGWVTEASVRGGDATPLNISPNVRDRNSVQEDDLDSLIHLQYGDAPSDNQNSIETPAAWEYALANGEYQVTVAVGDPSFTDSNHVINIEGESVISGFAPTNEQLFDSRTTTVEVTDGKLSIDAIGGSNTKLNFVEIAAADGTPVSNTPVTSTPINADDDSDGANDAIAGDNNVETVEAAEGDGAINVNFGTPSTGSNSGFIQDIGAAYSAEQGYGWVTEATAGNESPTTLDVFANARDRGASGTGSVNDSLIHLQYPTGLGNSATSVTTPAAWEYALENGEYEVTVGVGDADFVDSSHSINVEGESVISDFTPSQDGEAFAIGTATVEVTDGRLTLDALGGDNTKINYISIVPTSDMDTADVDTADLADFSVGDLI